MTAKVLFVCDACGEETNKANDERGDDKWQHVEVRYGARLFKLRPELGVAIGFDLCGKCSVGLWDKLYALAPRMPR